MWPPQLLANVLYQSFNGNEDDYMDQMVLAVQEWLMKLMQGINIIVKSRKTVRLCGRQ